VIIPDNVVKALGMVLWEEFGKVWKCGAEKP
jgi:hypothetical protein